MSECTLIVSWSCDRDSCNNEVVWAGSRLLVNWNETVLKGEEFNSQLPCIRLVLLRISFVFVSVVLNVKQWGLMHTSKISITIARVLHPGQSLMYNRNDCRCNTSWDDLDFVLSLLTRKVFLHVLLEIWFIYFNQKFKKITIYSHQKYNQFEFTYFL